MAFCDLCGTQCNPFNHASAAEGRREVYDLFAPLDFRNPTMITIGDGRPAAIATTDPNDPGDPFDGIGAAVPAPASSSAAIPSPGELRGRTVYFDLETAPDESRLHLFDLDPLPLRRAETPASECPDVDDALAGSIELFRSHLENAWPDDAWLDYVAIREHQSPKPRAGIASAISSFRERRAALSNAEAERRKLLSVTPEYCQIVAFAWALDDTRPAKSMVVGVNDATEEDVLRAFWRLAKGARRLCGFNVSGFDLPVLFVRSAILDVPPSRQLDLKPWGGDVLDLMKVRFANGRAMGLKPLAKCLGIDVPAGDVEGSQVYDLWRSDPAALAAYAASDVEITRALHRRYAGYFCP